MCCLGTGSSCPTVSFASESKINYSFGTPAVGLSTIQYRQRGYPFSGTHEFKNICNQLRIFRAILRPRGRFEESFKPFKFHICLCHYGMSLFWDIVSKRSLMVNLGAAIHSSLLSGGHCTFGSSISLDVSTYALCRGSYLSGTLGVRSQLGQ